MLGQFVELDLSSKEHSLHADNLRHRLIYARHRLPLAKVELDSLMEQRADEDSIPTQERIYIALRIAVLRAELSELRPIVAEARVASKLRATGKATLFHLGPNDKK